MGKHFSLRLFSLALGVIAIAAAPRPAAATGFTYKLLYAFCSEAGCADGSDPMAGLIMDSQGNLYGTTYGGGAHQAGTVFKLTPNQTETVLYDFCSAAGCADGQNPAAGLVMDAHGNLYGTTVNGGAGLSGTVFEVTPGGKETVLWSFCTTDCADGIYPVAGLVMDAKGHLYGTTSSGFGSGGTGTLFEVTRSGEEKNIYRFCSVAQCADGAYPHAGLIMDAKGDFYGTTSEGGANPTPNGGGGGTVFKVTHAGKETVLYSFCAATGCADGASPGAGVIMDAKGDLYGTTAIGGANPGPNGGGGGTVFKVTHAGKETVLHSFCAATGCADGQNPEASLVMDPSGNLYGTTVSGGTGAGSGGTAFEMTPKGKETVLFDFCAAPDCTGGETIPAGLLMDANGNLYGTSQTGLSGSATPFGSVFELVRN